MHYTGLNVYAYSHKYFEVLYGTYLTVPDGTTLLLIVLVLRCHADLGFALKLGERTGALARSVRELGDQACAVPSKKLVDFLRLHSKVVEDLGRLFHGQLAQVLQ